MIRKQSLFNNQLKTLILLAVIAVGMPAELKAANPSAADALKLTPIQRDVDYDQPASAAIKSCTIKAEKVNNFTGWVVRNSNDQILRRFVDSNGDNVVDQWSYFKNGLEVYRDIDSNFNNKADQYRWFSLGGSRWGVDENEDRVIDDWKQISAEEVTAEVVAALKNKDVQQFRRLLVTKKEIDSLGLSKKQQKDVLDRSTQAASKFRDLIRKQKLVNKTTKFIDFGGNRPGVVPAGTDGSTKDIMVYENVVALVESAGKTSQLDVGTLLRIEDRWRLIGLPQFGLSNEVASSSGYFFQSSIARRPDVQQPQLHQGPNEKSQAFMAKLEKLDRQIESASPKRQTLLNVERAELLESLIRSASDRQSRAMWVRQMADTISAAIQVGTYSGGIERLQSLEKSLEKSAADKKLLAYVQFRRMSAAYSQKLQAKNVKIAKVQEQWLEDLESFVKKHGKSAEAAEAMMQLGIAQEFAGEEDQAIKWYGRISSEFPNSLPGKKALGAKKRLQSVGKRISLKGNTLNGKTVDLKRYQRKLVLIQYWASWCEPCKSDMAQIKQLVSKYGSKGFAVIGVNLDNTPKEAIGYLKSNRTPWVQIHEQGGLESRLANELGILTLPTMILVGQDGRVLNRGIHITELESEVQKSLK